VNNYSNRLRLPLRGTSASGFAVFGFAVPNREFIQQQTEQTPKLNLRAGKGKKQNCKKQNCGQLHETKI
jgi:serine protease inhibitor ecotin